MNDTKWTEGPWINDNGLVTGWDSGAVSYDIFDVNSTWAGNDEEGNANAHLIAAAPELYEACREALDGLAAHAIGSCGSDANSDRNVKEVRRIHAQLGDALKKARGES